MSASTTEDALRTKNANPFRPGGGIRVQSSSRLPWSAETLNILDQYKRVFEEIKMKNLHSKSNQVVLAAGAIALGLLLAPMVSGFTFQPQSEKPSVAAGEKLKLEGVVLKRDGETMVIRDVQGKHFVVLLTDETTIKTTKKGVFRGGKTHGV